MSLNIKTPVTAETPNGYKRVAGNASGAADKITYSNTTSGLNATNVQNAIDETLSKRMALNMSNITTEGVAKINSSVMENYEKGSDTTAITAADSIDEALAKHENRLDNLGAAAAKGVVTTIPTTTATNNDVPTTLAVQTELNKKANETTISSVDSTVSTNTVPECLGYAGVKMIGGKTQKVVQLLQHGNMDGSGWSAFSESYLSVSMSNNELTATVLSSSTGYYIGATNTSGLSIPKNHVILVKADFNPSVKTSFGFDINYVRNRTECNANTYTTVYDRFEALDNYSGVVTSPTNMSTGDTYKVKNFQIFDLTAMFGSGNEPTTEQFIAMFNEAYYPYGNYLYSASVEKIVSCGKNLFDGSYTPHTYLDDTYGKYMVDASLGNTYTPIVKCKPNTTYDIWRDTENSNRLRIASFSEMPVNNSVCISGSYVGVCNSSSDSNPSHYEYTTPSNAQYIAVYVSNEGKTPKMTIKVKNTEVTEYIPYFKNEISLAEITKNLPDYGYSVPKADGSGDIYNWVDFENGVYHHNVGSVDLGSLKWAKDSGAFTTLFSKAKGQITGYSANLICARLNAEITEQIYNNAVDKSVGISTAGSDIWARDNSITYDETAFKNAMNGVILYHELATPELIPISTFIPPVPCEQDGTITLTNTHSLDVPNTICYKKEV